MSQGQFYPSDTNPNDTTGGGGCLCSPVRQIDCQPPYILVPTNEFDNIASPHVVVCRRCVIEMAAKLDGEILSAGENMNNQVTGERRDLPKPVLVPAIPDDEGEDEPPEV